MASLDLEITASSDDAYEQGDGTGLSTAATTISVVAFNILAVRRHTGCRFQAVTIARKAKVTACVLRCWFADTGNDDMACDIYFHDTDDAATFAAGANSIVNRLGALTTATTAWATDSIAAAGAAYYDSPDISAPLQEIFDRSGWVSGNDVAAILVARDQASLKSASMPSYDDAGSTEPHLVITYTPPSIHFHPGMDGLGSGGTWKF